jgi:GT2 family glycosyltransferase
MDLSIIIVNWNSVGYLRDCLRSVELEMRDSLLDYEIVVIDAASYDGCDRFVHESHPQVRFVQCNRNLGFGRANNLAFELSRGEAVLFLNPDTEVVGPAIATLHRRLRELPDAGVVGCRLLNSDGSLQTSCVQSFPTLLNQALDFEGLRQRWPASWLWGTAALYASGAAPRPVEALAGACVMLRREVFERIGRFSNEYFMYAEDIDLCHKTHAAGLVNYYVPEARVIHHGGGCSQEAPSNFSVVLMRESICRFLGKTRGRLYGALYRVSMLGVALTRLAALRGVEAVRALRGGARAGGSPLSGPRRKWQAVVQWSVRRQATVRQFEPAR